MNQQWLLPRNLMTVSLEIMRPHGRAGNEGLALWFGRQAEQGTLVTHVVDLEGPGFETTPLRLSISLAGMAALTELAEELDAYLVGQIHSHPENFVDLSWVDKAYGIRVPNYLSLVCPHYAQRHDTGLTDCGAHVFESGAYRRMRPDETGRRLKIVSALAERQVLEIAP